MKKGIKSIIGMSLFFPIYAMAANSIIVTDAEYGKYSAGKTCDATKKVQKLCNGLETCSFAVNSSLCEFNPAPDMEKLLLVNYTCSSIRMYNYTTYTDKSVIILSCKNKKE